MIGSTEASIDIQCLTLAIRRFGTDFGGGYTFDFDEKAGFVAGAATNRLNERSATSSAISSMIPGITMAPSKLLYGRMTLTNVLISIITHP